MVSIKSVKKAHTIQCKDAVTKEAVQAVFSKSRDAVYNDISIHTVKLADEDAHCIYSGFNTVSAKKATIGYIHTDMSGYKKVNKNLTIEELFRNI